MLKVSTHERIDELVGVVADQLGVPGADPFEAPLLVAPTRGMARHLVQQLAIQLGILANAPVVRPAGFRDRVASLQSGGADSIGLWSIHSMAWALLDLDRPTLGDYPGAYAIARLFDRYHVHRPEMICTWSSGRLVDPRGEPLAGTRLMQARLWTKLRDAAAVPSPAELLLAPVPTFGDVIGAGSGPLPAIPRQVHLVGLTEISPLLVRLCMGLARSGREIHVAMLRPAGPPLDAWSSPFRVALEVWADAGVPVEMRSSTVGRQSAVRSASPAAARAPWPQTVEELSETADPVGRDGSPAVEMHRCHGTVRQLENLRDAIAGYLADDPTLTEADILVAVAQPERFGPLIDAVWGRSAEFDAPTDRDDGPPALRYASTTNSAGRPGDASMVFGAFLALLGGRYRASDVLAFVGLAPVRARFGWSATDIDSMADLVERAGVRWGLDSRSRAAAGFSGGPASECDANTWRFGLDRLLIGAMVGDGESVGEAVGFGVESDALRLTERLAQAIEVFASVEAQSAERRTVGEWTRVLLDAHDQLTTYDSTADRSREQLTRAVTKVQPRAADPLVTLADAVRSLQVGLEPSSGSSTAAPGAITVAPMHDLRGVPFRVIALLGADAGAFAAGDASAPDDLSVRPPMLGDVARRDADRQVVAELFSAAVDRFAIFFDGHDERTGAPVPEPTLVEELSELLAAAHPPVPVIEFDERRTATDPANFTGAQPADQLPAHGDAPDGEPQRLTVPRDSVLRDSVPRVTAPRVTASFDAAAAVTARLLADPGRLPSRRRALAELVPSLDPIGAPDRLELATLARFLDDPLSPLLAERARASVAGGRDTASDSLPVEPGNLDLWKLRSEALEAAQFSSDDSGLSRLVGLQRQWIRDGRLLPGELGTRTALAATSVAAEVLDAARSAGAPRGAAERVHLDLPATVTGVCRLVGDSEVTIGPDGVRHLVRISASRRKVSALVQVWVELMALVAAEPDRPHRAVYSCRTESSSSRGPNAEAWTIVPRDPIGSHRHACDALRFVLEQFNNARSTVVPLFAATTYYLSEDDRSAAQRAWNGAGFGGERDKPSTAAVLGQPSFADLCAVLDVAGTAEALWHGAVHPSVVLTAPGERS